MRTHVLVIFITALSLAPLANAWKEVGNAAGIAEQNIIYAMQNSESLLSEVGKMLTSKSDKALLTEFIADLSKARLEFSYDEKDYRVFEVCGNTWTLYSANLMKSDQDGNGILSLKESYKLLLEIFAFKNAYRYSVDDGNPLFLQFEENLLRILNASEKTLVLRTFGEELQWTELSDAYYLFYVDTKPLRLTNALLKERLCQGELTDLKLRDPSLVSAHARAVDVRLLVSVDSYYQCDGKVMSKRLMLDLIANQKTAQLELH